MLYLPAPGSPGATTKEDSDEEDPLDAFMSNLVNIKLNLFYSDIVIMIFIDFKEKEAKNQGVNKALKEAVSVS